MRIEYSDFLPIWKDFIKDAESVLNVQMVAHHFYNLGLSDKSETKGKEFDEVIVDELHKPAKGLSDEKIQELADKYLTYVLYDEDEYGYEVEITGELAFYDAIIEEINKGVA